MPPSLPPGPALELVRPDGVVDTLLDTDAGRFTEAHAGDLCSLLGIVGAVAMVANHRVGHSPTIERFAGKVITGAVGAAGLDTAIQARNVLADGGDGAVARGNERSTWGTVAYAATGMIPAASLGAIRGLHRHPSRQEVAALTALAANGGMLGYELVSRGADMVGGREDASGYGSALASLGGFVVAQRYLLRR